MGVGPTDETLTINFNLAAMAHASFCKEVNQISYLNNNKTLDVPVISLDTYCERNYIDAIDLIKIDVEGFELEVFKGAYNVFNNIRPRFIQIVFNQHQLFRNTTLHFFGNQLKDYMTYQLLPGRWEKRDSRDSLSNIFQFSNFVFVRPDIDVTLI